MKNRYENGLEIYRKSLGKLIMFEKCLMQNNVLKPMNFNDFRVRVVWKIIEKTKTKKNYKTQPRKINELSMKNHQKRDSKLNRKSSKKTFIPLGIPN